jgi:hypothetical protein
MNWKALITAPTLTPRHTGHQLLFTWDLRSSGMLRLVTTQSSTDLTAAEAWYHAVHTVTSEQVPQLYTQRHTQFHTWPLNYGCAVFRCRDEYVYCHMHFAHTTICLQGSSQWELGNYFNKVHLPQQVKIIPAAKSNKDRKPLTNCP